MKPIDAHETEAIIDATGTVHVGQLPFATGDRVRVLILRDAHPRHTPTDIQTSRRIRQGMSGGILRYEHPNDPVGVEDWDMLRDHDDDTSPRETGQ